MALANLPSGWALFRMGAGDGVPPGLPSMPMGSADPPAVAGPGSTAAQAATGDAAALAAAVTAKVSGAIESVAVAAYSVSALRVVWTAASQWPGAASATATVSTPVDTQRVQHARRLARAKASALARTESKCHRLLLGARRQVSRFATGNQWQCSATHAGHKLCSQP